MKTIITSNRLRYTLCTLFLCVTWSATAQQLYVSSGGGGGTGMVGEYDPNTGDPINPSLLTNLSFVYGLGSSGDNLYVSTESTGVGDYNVSTGSWNPTFLTGTNFPAGVVQSDGNIFVANYGASTVGEYASNGTLINPNYLTNLNGAWGLAVSGSDLWVTSYNNNTVTEYSTAGTSPTPILTISVTNPEGLALSNNILYVSSAAQTVSAYNATTGAPDSNFTTITGLFAPNGLAVLGNELFVANDISPGGTVGVYSAITGNPINPGLIPVPNGPIGLAIITVPEPSTWSMIGVGGVALLGIMARKKHRTA
jgi:hypothetical protein